MRIHLLSVSQKPSPWLQQGLNEYQKRIPKPFSFSETILPPQKNIQHLSQSKRQATESERMRAAIPTGHKTIALSEHGQSMDSHAWAQALQQHQEEGKKLCFLLGPADGFDAKTLAHCQTAWSLSPLTFPHLLAKLIFIEQLYRAITILNQHPYHR